MKIAAYILNVLFNEVYAAILKIMDVLEIKIELQCKQYADWYDAEHIKCQKGASLSSVKKVRAARIMNQIQE